MEKTENKFTPGPMIYLTGDRYIYSRLEDGCRGLPVVKILGESSPESQAIGNLFAAAPDLLAALEKLELAASMAELFNNSDSNPQAVRLRSSLDEARKAIAKAKGAL